MRICVVGSAVSKGPVHSKRLVLPIQRYVKNRPEDEPAALLCINTGREARRHLQLSIYIRATAYVRETYWKLIGRSMAALSTVLSANSILPPASSHSAFIAAGKNLSRVSEVSLFPLFYYLTFWSRNFTFKF